MQSLTFLQLYEYCKCNYSSACILQADMHRHVYVHTGMPCKLNHYMHACFTCNYPEALSHCGHGHDLTSVAQLSVINIADIMMIKYWHQSTFAETPSTSHCSKEARQRWASMLVTYNIHYESTYFLHGACIHLLVYSIGYVSTYVLYMHIIYASHIYEYMHVCI